MKKMRHDAAREASQPAPASESRVSPGSLTALVGLGAISALWALFLWSQLVLARAGGMPFCDLSGRGQCAALWDSPFASAIHERSGLPIAGWGLAWGIAAFALPLVALWREAEGRRAPALLSAIRILAAVGVAIVVLMMAVSATERAFCLGCFASYLLVAGFAGIALPGWQRVGLPDPIRGAAIALTASAASLLLLLYPGTKTPQTAAEAGRSALAHAPSAVAASAGGTGSPQLDAQIQEFVSSLEPRSKQLFSDSLHIYRSSPVSAPPPPRALRGPGDAAVRITEFTDIRCEHCADLHGTLATLEKNVDRARFSVDSRQFPLDAECNPLMQNRADPVRCLAAKARICIEGRPQAFEAAGRLFAEQKTLTSQRIFELLGPAIPRAELQACVVTPQTAAKLQSDIDAARPYDPEGTPIVLINGRKATSFAPFLYVAVLTGGATEHPAFASLPPPNPQAHLH